MTCFLVYEVVQLPDSNLGPCWWVTALGGTWLTCVSCRWIAKTAWRRQWSCCHLQWFAVPVIRLATSQKHAQSSIGTLLPNRLHWLCTLFLIQPAQFLNVRLTLEPFMSQGKQFTFARDLYDKQMIFILYHRHLVAESQCPLTSYFHPVPLGKPLPPESRRIRLQRPSCPCWVSLIPHFCCIELKKSCFSSLDLSTAFPRSVFLSHPPGLCVPFSTGLFPLASVSPFSNAFPEFLSQFLKVTKVLYWVSLSLQPYLFFWMKGSTREWVYQFNAMESNGIILDVVLSCHLSIVGHLCSLHLWLFDGIFLKCQPWFLLRPSWWWASSLSCCSPPSEDASVTFLSQDMSLQRGKNGNVFSSGSLGRRASRRWSKILSGWRSLGVWEDAVKTVCALYRSMCCIPMVLEVKGVNV